MTKPATPPKAPKQNFVPTPGPKKVSKTNPGKWPRKKVISGSRELPQGK